MSEHVRAALAHLDSPLPADDAGALRRLNLGYALCADYADLDVLEDLFTPDAVWDGSEFGFGRHEGRTAIRAAFGGLCGPDVRQIHFSSGLLTWQIEPGLAGGVSYFSALRRQPDGVSRQAFGCYEDVYERVDGGSSGRWRFRGRTLRLRIVGR